MSGALEGIRVVELAHERVAFAGKLLADMGADVITVEPRGGCATRHHGPFVDDVEDPERCLTWWHYNTSKRGVTLDIDEPRGRELLGALAAGADVFLEGETPGRLAALGLDYDDLRAPNEGLIMVSVTPFGRSGPRSTDPATDLTLLAGGGPVWMCGYDDHTLPPVRGEGNQAYHTGAHFAVLSTLVAVLGRGPSGAGQHIDVNLHAAVNVTTEAGSYAYLVAGDEMQRQTGRHASAEPSPPMQTRCADGRYANTGIGLRKPSEFAALCEWLDTAGFAADFPKRDALQRASRLPFLDPRKAATDPGVMEILVAGREAVEFIATRLPAYEFFVGSQERGIPTGIVYSPDEALDDPHHRARGLAVVVEHDDLGRSVTYPGAPYLFHGSPWRIARRAPHLGEHNAEVYASLGIDEADLAKLRASGVV
jgi:crotonobetainyl-CoA:carnitine CoA-transferase CaiB-like acyl-CoA transferase